MTHERNQHELLSAYIDGELPPADRLRAEQMLEDSVDARRELDEFAELSELIKSLPGEPAPPELLPSILRRAERETLLPPTAPPESPTESQSTPAAAVPPSSTKPSAAKHKPPAKLWVTALLGLAATAAALLVAVPWLTRSGSGLLDSHVASSNNQAAETSPASEVAIVSESQRAPAAKDADDAARNVAVVATADMLAGNRTEADRAAPSSPARTEFGAAGRLRLNADGLKNIHRGDSLQYFNTSGTNVTTYMVTVVDIKQALNQMQVLLARNDIPVRMPADETISVEAEGTNRRTGADKADGNADRVEGNAAGGDRLFAVYVETTPDRFAAALKDVLHDELLAQLQPKPPVDVAQIEVAELGRPRRQLFQAEAAGLPARRPAAAGHRALVIPRRGPAKKPGEAKPAQAAAPRKAKPKPPAEPAPKAIAADSAGRSKDEDEKDHDPRSESRNSLGMAGESELPSFQLQVQLAPLPAMGRGRKLADASNERSQQRGAAPALAAAETSGSRPVAAPVPGPVTFERAAEKQRLANTGQSPDERPLDPKAGEAPAPVRVLFVFREADRPSRPPAARP